MTKPMKTLIASFIMLSASSFSMANESDEAPAVTYEYKVLSYGKFEAASNIEKALNTYGEDGWKMEGMNQIIFNGTHSEVRFYLSRKKSQ